MVRFLGLKSYLTTDRSSILKQRIVAARHSCMSKAELVRERVADRFKCPLCFCVPCVVLAIALMTVVVLYATIPYRKGLEYRSSVCTVQKIEFSQKGSCSGGTEQFEPCYKIMVVYNATGEDRQAVLMENEQTVFHCEKCSYTFGKGELFNKGCRDEPRSCVMKYNDKYGQINSKYRCHYNPANPQDVFREFKTTHAKAIYQTLLPLLLILLFTLGFIFLRCDDNQRRKINKQIKQHKYHQKTTTSTNTSKHHQDTSPDTKSNSSLTSDSPASSADSTAAMYRVRKKKMPCTKAHTFSTRDEEDTILEEKPISPLPRKQTDSYMQVKVDRLLRPHCDCVSSPCSSLSNGFDLTRVKEHFRPVIPRQQYCHNETVRQSRRAFRYLPETVV